MRVAQYTFLHRILILWSRSLCMYLNIIFLFLDHKMFLVIHENIFNLLINFIYSTWLDIQENLWGCWEVLVSQSILVHGGFYLYLYMHLLIYISLLYNNFLKKKYWSFFKKMFLCRWFFNVVGDGKCPISDTWWQTETGGFMVFLLFSI